MTVEAPNRFQLLSGTGPVANTTAANHNVLGKDAFLRLLVTQLQHQNPLEPMQDTQFISQMANFSSLEQMNNMVRAFEQLQESLDSVLLPSILMQQAYSMLGREITYAVLDDEGKAVTRTGVVQGVSVRNGSPFYYIGADYGVFEYQVLRVAAGPGQSTQDIKDWLVRIEELLRNNGSIPTNPPPEPDGEEDNDGS